MTTKHASHIAKDIHEVTICLNAGHVLTDNDQAVLKKALDDMRVFLAAQFQVEKCLVYALVELFEAIDRSTNVLQDRQRIDALHMLADELYSQLLDIFVLAGTQALAAQPQLKELFIAEVVDLATRIRMGYSIDQQHFELMLLNLEQLLALSRHTPFIDKDLAACCIDCFVFFNVSPGFHSEHALITLPKLVHRLQNKIKVLLTD